jgi:hypothetical protein
MLEGGERRPLKGVGGGVALMLTGAGLIKTGIGKEEPA